MTSVGADRIGVDDLFADDIDAVVELVERHGDVARYGSRAMAVLSFALDRATELGATSVVGDLEYRLARHAVDRSELDVAMGHLDRACAAFEAAGRHDAAARTVLGRMHVLDEYGRHGDVVELGHETIVHLESLGDDPSIVWLRGAIEENIGVASGLMGRHHDAMEHYRRAHTAFATADCLDDAARVVANQGCELLDLGRAGEAMAALDEARARFVDADELLWVAKVDAHRGEAQLAMGHLTNAVELLRSACDALEALGAVAEHERAIAALVAAYTELRLIDEALSAADRLVARLRSADRPHDLADALVARGRASMIDGALTDASTDLVEAVELLTKVGDRGSAATALALLARVDALRGDLDAAVTSAGRAAADALELDREADHLEAAVLLAELTIARDPHRALADATALASRAAECGLPLLHARVEHVIGMAAYAAGDPHTAERALADANRRVTALHEALDTAEWRLRFLHDRRALHETYADVLLSTGRVADALDVLDQPRRLLTGVGSASSDELSATLHALPRATAADRAMLIERVRRLAPVQPQRELTRAVASVPAGRTALVYRVRNDRVGAFVVTDHETVWLDLCDTTDVRRAVQRLGANWRHRRLFDASHSLRLRHEQLGLLQHLHSAIVEPLLPWCTAELDIVSDGLVHGVPFAALHDGTTHFGLRHVIRDVGSLVSAPSMPVADRRRVVAIGIADDLAPNVEREIDTVADHYLESVRLTGADATSERLIASLGRAQVVHLAGHGVFRTDNPGRSSIRLADRAITADELAVAGVRDAVVVVNVCDGGRRDATVGRVEAAGMPQRLLAGGAAAVIGPRVVLDDRDATAMATFIHRHLAAGAEVACALQAAQRDAHDAGIDPAAWGAFAAHVSHRPVHSCQHSLDRVKEPSP